MFAGLLLRELDLQPRLILDEFHLACTEEFHVLNPANPLLRARCQRWNHRLLARPAHYERVERVAFLGKTNILGGEVLTIGLVELRVAGLDLRTWAGAEDLVGPGRVDAFAIHRHPRGDAFENRHL